VSNETFDAIFLGGNALHVVFIFVGIILGLIAIGMAVSTGIHRQNVMQDAVPVTARIVSINSSGRPTIMYEVNGEEITTVLRWSSSNMYVGMPMQLYVNLQNHDEFIHVGLADWFTSLIFGGLSLIVCGAGTVSLIKARRKKKLDTWLLEYGIPAWATVVGLEIVKDPDFDYESSPDKILVAVYNGKRLKSETLENPDYLKVGKHVKVLFHPENNDIYTLDLFNKSSLEPSQPPE